MFTTLMIFHALVSVLLIIMVLLQFGKGAEAGLISGGASDAVFTGSQKGNILGKITLVLCVVFVANCIILARLQSGKVSSSLLDDEAPVARTLNPDFAGESEEAPAEETATEVEAAQ